MTTETEGKEKKENGAGSVTTHGMRKGLKNEWGRKPLNILNEDDTEDVKFFKFAKRYLGWLATLLAIPVLSSFLGILEPPEYEPGKKFKLEILSSFLCLMMFGGTFLLRGVLGKWALDQHVWKRFIPFSIVIFFSIVGIFLIGSYYEIYPDTKQDVRLKIWIYLLIYCSLTLSLGIILVTSFSQLAGQTIQTIIDSRLSGTSSKQVFNMVQNYADFLDHRNANLFEIGNGILRDLQEHLQSLSRGEIRVRGNDAPLVQDLLLDSFEKSFDAVSDRDLDFWTRKRFPHIADVYIESNYRAIIDHQTIITRIFIFTAADLKNSSQDIEKVLKEHHDRKVGWAVAIYEDLFKSPRILETAMDFAIFNNDKAVSYFRDFREETRQFRAIFATEENDKEIKDQIKQYDRILSHCLMVNSTFLKNCTRLKNTSVSAWLSRVKSDALGYLDYLKKNEQELEKQTFLIEVNDTSEIKNAVGTLQTFYEGKAKRSARV